jgi:AcrR family transcriptional regulator
MPIPDCDVRDPRIRRTRQLLQTALRDLLQAKNLDELSVQDITDAATVNRATFYDHYNDKFALFEALVEASFHKLLNERNVQFNGSCISGLSAIVLAVCDFLTQIRSNPAACARHNSFEPLLESAITGSIKRVLLQGLKDRKEPSAPPAEMLATAVGWAIYGAVKSWFYGVNRVSAEEIAPQIVALIIPMLHPAESAPELPTPAVAPHGLAH